jgi:hypothetical protein
MPLIALIVLAVLMVILNPLFGDGKAMADRHPANVNMSRSKK